MALATESSTQTPQNKPAKRVRFLLHGTGNGEKWARDSEDEDVPEPDANKRVRLLSPPPSPEPGKSVTPGERPKVSARFLLNPASEAGARNKNDQSPKSVRFLLPSGEERLGRTGCESR